MDEDLIRMYIQHGRRDNGEECNDSQNVKATAETASTATNGPDRRESP